MPPAAREDLEFCTAEKKICGKTCNVVLNCRIVICHNSKYHNI